MAERSYNERVDDSILVGAHRIAHARGSSLRSAIEGHLRQCLDNGRASDGTDMPDYWRHRVGRCDALIQEPDDNALMKMARDALAREA